MLICYILFFCFATVVVECQEKGSDGYIHIDNKRKLKLYEPAIDIQNYNYPNEAPAALLQTWAYTCHTWNKLQLTCSDINLPESPPCTNFYLEVDNGEEKRKFCGMIKDLTIISSANELRLTLKTNKYYAGGIINCQVLGFNPDYTTLAPPTTTQSYLDMDSPEIDSSEHGVTKGTKSTTCPCGWANKSPARIVGGEETKPQEYPFMAALVAKDVGIPFCGATIVSSYHAITAAHCTIKLTELDVTAELVVGLHDYTRDSKMTEVYGIAKILQHELYDPSIVLNDISILVTDRKIQFNDFVGRACLPNKRLPLDHQYVKMLGWGRTNVAEDTSRVLRETDLRIVPMKDCLDVWSEFIPQNNPKHLCTFAKRRSTCKGDSGGPALWVDPETNRYTLVGLTSYGINCSPDIPSVKTEVAAFLDWIHSKIMVTTPGGRSDTCHKEE